MAPNTCEALLLEDVVESLLDEGFHGLIEIIGARGAGKSTALAHLASLGIADRIVLLDEPTRADLVNAADTSTVVYVTRRTLDLTIQRYELAPWSRDDVIEFLLAKHPDACSSVMSRLVTDDAWESLEGRPGVISLVCQQMATDSNSTNVRTALRRAVLQLAGDDQTCEVIRQYATAILFRQREFAETIARELAADGTKGRLIDVLNTYLVQILFSADHLVSLLKSHAEFAFPASRLPIELVNEMGQLIQSEPAALSRLRRLVSMCETNYLAMAASVLHAADSDWRPSCRHHTNLFGAYLAEAKWQSIELQNIILDQADMRRSNLCDASLECSLVGANLQGVWAERAIFINSSCACADLCNAVLSEAELVAGDFRRAEFFGADLQRVAASDCDFSSANFTNASLRHGRFENCSFDEAMFENVDLGDADVNHSCFWQVNLLSANLTGANFGYTNLGGCNLENIVWLNAMLRGANLARADLTGSKMHRADLREAVLYQAGLAEVDWEGADLRSADLRWCAFHMGSSRSGLVGSPYPCHGSRTHFYTNDFEDQTHKSPEEIRKANLCGTDLRGALIEGTDFYLVDLRGAKYDRQQAEHFRRCDAILEDFCR